MTEPATVAGLDAAKLVAFGSAGLVMLGTIWGVARGRGLRPFSGFSLLLGAAAATLTLILPALTFGAVLKTPVLASLLAAGAVAGLVAGLRPRVGRDAGRVTIMGGAWHGVPLALSIACLQVAGGLQSADGVILAVAALHVSAALVVGAAFVLVARRLAEGFGRPAVVLAAATPGAVPSILAPLASGIPATVRVSAAAPVDPPFAPVVAPSPAAAAPSGPAGPRTAGVVISCAACGSPVSVGWRHCVTCGAALTWG